VWSKKKRADKEEEVQAVIAKVLPRYIVLVEGVTSTVTSSKHVEIDVCIIYQPCAIHWNTPLAKQR